MKQLLFLSLQLLLLSNLSAQQFTTLPGFGKVDKLELEMKECSFEKDAAAMVLFDEGEAVYKFSPGAMETDFIQTVHRVRIKIFSNKGFGEANIRIRYPSADRDISLTSISAQTYNLDASGNIVVTKVDKDAIYDKPVNSRYSEKIFAFPDVKEGSVIEYKYVLDGGAERIWYFQRSIPVKFSRMILDFPDELRLSITPYYNVAVQKGNEKKSSGNYSWYEVQDVPALVAEPYMSSVEDYLQKMEMTVAGYDFPGKPFIDRSFTWQRIVEALVKNERFGQQLNKNIPRTADLDQMLQPVITDPYKKMKIIYQYVRNNMAWNNYDDIWALYGVKAAWKDKKGTSGEINLILINLLKDAGVNAAPLLVSTTHHGTINAMVPNPSQFDRVMAYVTIDSKHYVLDATEKNTPADLIPYDVAASAGLAIEKPGSNEWNWKELWDENNRMEKNIFVYAEIDTKSNMTGNASVTAINYAKLKLLPLLSGGNDKWKDELASGNNASIDSFTVSNESEEAPLVGSFNFSIPTNASGDYHYFRPVIFSGFEKNPFIAQQRIADVFFGVNQLYKFTGNFSLPEGYVIEELPKNITMIMPDTSIVFSRQFNFAEGLLTVNARIEFNSPIYAVAGYPDFAAFYKKLYDLLNEKIVYRKKQ